MEPLRRKTHCYYSHTFTCLTHWHTHTDTWMNAQSHEHSYPHHTTTCAMSTVLTAHTHKHRYTYSPICLLDGWVGLDKETQGTQMCPCLNHVLCCPEQLLIFYRVPITITQTPSPTPSIFLFTSSVSLPIWDKNGEKDPTIQWTTKICWWELIHWINDF